MIVIADTSPINYLIWIGEIEVLRRLYGQIIVPASVCANSNGRALLKQWASRSEGLPDFKSAVARLSQTNFHIAQEVLDRLLREEE